MVGREGATLGRRQTNTIAFSHESGGTVMGIDASISGEHARIVYDEDGDFLHIMDGTPTKVRAMLCFGTITIIKSLPSTWFRSPERLGLVRIACCRASPRRCRLAWSCLISEERNGVSYDCRRFHMTCRDGRTIGVPGARVSAGVVRKV